MQKPPTGSHPETPLSLNQGRADSAKNEGDSPADRKVFVVDAHSLIHQLFHAIAPLTAPDGRPVNAVFGFVRDILNLLRQYQPDYLICAFESAEPTFRKEMYAEYKAQRPRLDDDLRSQFELIRRFMEALGVLCVSVPGYEADDILATIARQVEREGGECVLVTNDKDCRQLLSDKVRLLNLRKRTFLDAAGLEAEWGIRPDQAADFQILVGDATDNIPGVPGVGPKTAAKWLRQYGSLDQILAQADKIQPEKLRRNLIASRDRMVATRPLVELRTDVPLPFCRDAARPGPIRREAVQQLCEELGFRSLLPEIERLPTTAVDTRRPPQIAVNAQVVDDPHTFRELVERLRTAACISLDTETTDIRPRWASLVGIALSTGPEAAYYIPVRGPEGAKTLPEAEVVAALRPVWEDAQIPKLGQNLKYDSIILRNIGVSLRGIEFDTLIAAYLLDAGSRSHSLDELAKRYLEYETTKIDELIGKGKQQRQIDSVEIPRVAAYAGQDVTLPWHLRDRLEPQLQGEGLQSIFQELEIPLISVLADMEYRGIRIDAEYLDSLSRQFAERMAELEAEIHRLAGMTFNIGSPKQLQEVLFHRMHLPPVKRTKTGTSTDSEVLEELAPLHPLPQKILEYRQYAKLKGTYVDALPQMVCPRTGRIHASFHQAVTATGRLSSSDPNLQNIPIRTEEGRAIRAAFIAEEDWALVSADYSQIELRILAHLSGDEHLCRAFAEDQDIHHAVAAEVFGVPPAAVTPEMRRRAKAVNFGVIYGQTPFGLAKQLRISQEEAAQFIDSYFARYPGINRFFETVLADCREHGFVQTILGRKRKISGVREDPNRQRNLPERTAVNTVIQGSAADLIKKAMIRVHGRLRQERLQAALLVQIHDELLLECPCMELPLVTELLREEMQNAFSLNVPLKVDVRSGPNWGEMQALESR
ncbi:MAG: DNA polymerase I [Thermogutta sp.]|nr:DNA polymerase I [Thermogutta sp.]